MSDAATDLIHHPYVPPVGFVAPQPGVFKASTVIFPDVAALRARNWKYKEGYTYGLHGTPTTFMLEERIATLEGGTHCVLVPSGLAAIATVDMALLSAGDTVLLPDNAYGPGKALAEGELRNWGIGHQFYDPMDPADLRARIGPTTRLVWLEAPGSVTMEFPPLAQLAAVCRERGVTSVLDNTWGAGLAFNGFDLRGPPGSGADIVVQALTKYPSGGGDVLMGSIVTRVDALHLQIKLAHMRLGFGIGANDAETASRVRSVARPRELAGAVRQRGRRRACRRPVFRGLPRALQHGAGGCVLRRVAAVQAGLLLGRPDQPGRAL
jgi:cystathionine beta-lyase